MKSKGEQVVRERVISVWGFQQAVQPPTDFRDVASVAFAPDHFDQFDGMPPAPSRPSERVVDGAMHDPQGDGPKYFSISSLTDEGLSGQFLLQKTDAIQERRAGAQLVKATSSASILRRVSSVFSACPGSHAMAHTSPFDAQAQPVPLPARARVILPSFTLVSAISAVQSVLRLLMRSITMLQVATTSSIVRPHPLGIHRRPQVKQPR